MVFLSRVSKRSAKSSSSTRSNHLENQNNTTNGGILNFSSSSHRLSRRNLTVLRISCVLILAIVTLRVVWDVRLGSGGGHIRRWDDTIAGINFFMGDTDVPGVDLSTDDNTDPNIRGRKYGNTTNDGKYANAKTLPSPGNSSASGKLPVDALSFVSARNKTLRLPTDTHYVTSVWHSHYQFLHQLRTNNAGRGWDFVRYWREKEEVAARKKSGGCGRTLDVLAWLMDEMNTRNATLMLGYGNLIRVHREKEFIDTKNGKYLDDDFDLMAPPQSFVHIGTLEEELFDRYGWTMRAFCNNDDYVVFLQIFATCGHNFSLTRLKITSSVPAFDVCPLAKMAPANGVPLVKDLWGGTVFPESMVYPPRHIDFNSSGTSHILHLQLPNEVFDVMGCIYGNWTIPSGKHAGVNNKCQSYTK